MCRLGSRLDFVYNRKNGMPGDFLLLCAPRLLAEGDKRPSIKSFVLYER